ncbi:hypothetical protein KGF56_004186 [Candida oxycetoniae]|uniref:Large ribosomal subunit protein mL50 n=1 Tax=Candida oxycetoniae TaxID=497107 RepID=A0AAI9WWP1_9ASCO|nr:uncharacterized protein KGF56_004186 [Candida oxycetoniae]KAI3402934.1 hypothetical protein KGF56_004186 [Candida oxycetoniae]
MIGRNIAPILKTRSLTSSSINRSWFRDIYGRKKKSVTEIVSQQDKYADKEVVTIKHLTEKNSESYLKNLEASKVLPKSKVSDWKRHATIHPMLLESFYTKEKLQRVVDETYKNLTGKDITHSQYNTVSLNDIEFRFNLVKNLQSNLGFELNDFTVSKSHDLLTLYNSVEDFVNRRWKNERNPNAIVLRPEDFTAKNVYINEERNAFEKNKEFNKIRRQMQLAESAQQAKD